jgi:hypothetical protein
MASDDQLPPDLDGLAIWATPGLVTDPADPAAEPVAALTCVPSLSVHTRDTHPGAEPVDVIATALLGQGFELLAALDLTALTGLPVLPGWLAELDDTGRHLHVTDPTGSLCDGDLGGAVPTGWHQALDRRRLLVLLVASNGVDASDRAGDRAAALDTARRAGGVVGAQIRTHQPA